MSSKRHGKTGSKEYNTWSHMKRRCNNPQMSNYYLYGARGISVCSEWNSPNGFDAFLNDMGYAPSKSHSLDRIDNSKGYYKSNCRWATKSEQAINRRVAKESFTGIKNITKQENKFKVCITRREIKNGKIYLGLYESLDLAIIAKNEFHAMEGRYNEIVGP